MLDTTATAPRQPVTRRLPGIGFLTTGLILLSLSSALSQTAAAAPFKNGDLFVGRAMRPDTSDQFFDFGVKFSIAPVKAILKGVVKKQLAAYTKDNPEAAAMQEYLQYADTEQMRALANSGNLAAYKQALKDEMTKQGVQISPAQNAAIDGLDEAKLKTMADMIDIMNEKDDTLTFALTPWVGINFKYLRLKADIAIAGFTNGQLATPGLQLGNLGVEASTGASHGLLGHDFGWTLGVRGYAPTGTQEADVLALANLTTAPKFLHNYATVSPFAVIGLDLPFIQWSLHGEYVQMFAVRQDSVKASNMAYVQAGTGLLATLRWVGLSLELDGMFDVNNAQGVGGTWLLTGGVRGFLGPTNLGVAVQVPLAKPGSDGAYYSAGGLATGSPAAFNVLVDAKLRF